MTLEPELRALFDAPRAPLWEVNPAPAQARRATPSQPCPGGVTGNTVGGRVMGKLAELIIDLDYLGQYLGSRDTLFFDNIVSNPTGASTLGSFLRVDKAAAGRTFCSPRCLRSNGTPLNLFDGLLLKPDILDLARAEFYEIKPDNEGGFRDGRDDLRKYHCILGCLHRNHDRVRSRFTPEGALLGHSRPMPGTTFEPPTDVILYMPEFGTPPNVLKARRMLFKSRRAERGLLVYQFCPQNGQTVPDPQLVAGFNYQIERWQLAYRTTWGEVIPQTVPVIRDAEAEVRKQQAQTQPLPAEHRQGDVFDELNRQLFNPQRMALLVVGVLVLAVVVILTRGQLVRYIRPLAAALAAAVRELSLRAALYGKIALGLAFAQARAAQAQAAADEAKRATTPAAKREAANRAARLAAEATNHHRQARETGTRCDRTEGRLAGCLAALAAAASAIDPTSTTGSHPADKAKLAQSIAQLGAHTAATAAGQRALRQTLRGREEAAGRSVAAATAAARAVGGQVPSPCGPVSAEINRAFAHWSANPLRAGVTLRSSPVGAHPARQTTLEIVNHTPFQVRVWVGAPACRLLTIAAKATATLAVVPGRTYRLAGRVTNPPPGVPIIPAYGEQTYTAGQVHRMHLGEVRV